MKLNVDASFHVEEGAGATAAVIRDERGNFLAGHCRFMSYVVDVVTMETMAMRAGLIFANSLGFPRVEAVSFYSGD